MTSRTTPAARLVTVSALVLLLSACGGGSSGMDGPSNDDDINGDDDTMGEVEQALEYVTPANLAVCSSEDIEERVGFDMRDYYIHYDQVPPLLAANYNSPEDYIRALRVNPDVYSFVTDEAEQGALTEEGMATGYGFWFQPASDGVVRFREVLLGSPANRAGILRGDETISLNGRPIGEYTNVTLTEALYDTDAPITLVVRTGNEVPRTVVLQEETYRWVTAQSWVFRAEGLPTVGVLDVRRFLVTTEAEINTAIDFLIAENIDELIVDLRYNPGGRTVVAERLAAKIVGPSIDGVNFLVREWNDKYSEFNSISTLEAVSPSLNFSRIIVLQTDNSASASEAFVNGLEPYIDVTVIGGTTEGKIYTSNERTYCEKSIFAMRSTRTNALGVSVLGGIQPDCPVSDDWTLQAHFAEDPLISAGLDYVLDGTCPSDIISFSGRSGTTHGQGPSYNGSDYLPLVPGDIID